MASPSTGATKKSGETSKDKYIFLPPTDSDEEAESNIIQRELEKKMREIDAKITPEEHARITAVGDRARVILQNCTRRLEAFKCVEAFSALSQDEKKVVLKMKMSKNSKRNLDQLKNDYEKCGLTSKNNTVHGESNLNASTSSSSPSTSLKPKKNSK